MAHQLRTRGQNTARVQNAQPQCSDGMAANWLEMVFMASELNDQNVGYLTRVSTKPKFGPPMVSSRRGGISGNVAKPMRASMVPMASVLRHSG